MSVAGYVLAGGNSTRMGTDKALLRTGGVAMVQRIAGIVQHAAGSATLIGDPEKYRSLGFPVVADLRPGFGPLGGMEAALSHTDCEWNLIAACDLAALRADFLATLCAQAGRLDARADCLVPSGPDGRLQPLTAVYRRRCLAVFSAALDCARRKVNEALDSLEVRLWQTNDPQLFQNVNTPDDWNRYVNDLINDPSPR
jgi:molybdenum cofactor guanylyltransferase